jgi:hypothetical protein
MRGSTSWNRLSQPEASDYAVAFLTYVAGFAPSDRFGQSGTPIRATHKSYVKLGGSVEAVPAKTYSRAETDHGGVSSH